MPLAWLRTWTQIQKYGRPDISGLPTQNQILHPHNLVKNNLIIEIQEAKPIILGKHCWRISEASLTFFS